MEEFRSDEVWFQTFRAAHKVDMDAYLAGLEVKPTEIHESFLVNSPQLGGGPVAKAVPRSGHRIYMIQRDIPGIGLASAGQHLKISKGSQGIVEKIGDGIEWDHSYLTAEGTFCVYRAEDPKLILEHASMAGVPANPITEVEHIIHRVSF